MPWENLTHEAILLARFGDANCAINGSQDLLVRDWMDGESPLELPFGDRKQQSGLGYEHTV